MAKEPGLLHHTGSYVQCFGRHQGHSRPYANSVAVDTKRITAMMVHLEFEITSSRLGNAVSRVTDLYADKKLQANFTRAAEKPITGLQTFCAGCQPRSSEEEMVDISAGRGWHPSQEKCCGFFSAARETTSATRIGKGEEDRS